MLRRLNHITIIQSIGVSLLLLVSSFTVSAQDTVEVVDPILKQYLEDNWPSIFTPDGRMVVEAASDTVNDAFDIRGLGVSNADPVEHFWRVDQLLLDHNLLSSLPSLAQYPSVDTIDVSYNLLTEFPIIARHSEVARFVFEHNMITSVSDSLTAKSGYLTTVLGGHNELKSLPKFDHMNLLVEVDFTFNRLTFVDMIPLADHPNFDSVFHLMPQKPFGISQSISIDRGDDITLTQLFEESDTNDIYTWHKDDGSIVGNMAQLELSNLKENDEGIYTLTITNSNPNMSGISLRSEPITITVDTPTPPDTTCFTNESLDFETEIIDCQTPINLTINKSTFKNYSFPLTFTLTNNTTNLSDENQIGEFENIGQGTFSLLVSDAKNCSLSYPNFTNASKSDICDPVFSPNGDGIADSWYFNQTGQISIYNSRGSHILTLDGPARWNGTDINGAVVTPDYYSIISNDHPVFHLTVIY